jgi:uncharacterized protein
MEQPDVEAATQYALRRLGLELAPAFVYHSLTHTRDEVVPAAERLAAMEGVRGEDLLLLRTAAFYHDIGFVEQRADHEAAGVRIASLVLPRFGYRASQIEAVGAMIMATRLPQSPRTLLEQLLADADLDVLGRADFLARNRALRAELAAFGRPARDAQWYGEQLRFLRTHRYWTAAAQWLRDTQKQINCETLIRLLAECRPW